jgi:hypothetical membrane protein
MSIKGEGRPVGVYAIAAILGGLAWLVLGGIQAMNPTFDDVLESPIDYVNDGTFTVALVSTAVAVIGLHLAGIAPRPAALLVAGGYLLVAVGVFVGLLQGHSPRWFAAVGVPGNLLAVIGMVWMGITMIRRCPLPVWAGVLAILAGLFAVVTAENGTSVIAGVFWLYIGTQLFAPAHGKIGATQAM